MKAVFVALFSLVAVATAGLVSIPSTLGVGYAAPYAAQYVAPYASLGGYSYGYSALNAPLTYAAAPIAYTAPAIQSGYVAATPGAVHTAPLPEGPLAFSHHINTAPAPGTI